MFVGQDYNGHVIWYCKKCRTVEKYIFQCPVCKEEPVSEITGWCSIYCEPLIEGECQTGPDREMCCSPLCPTFRVEDVFCCDRCLTIFSYDSYIDWNDAMGLIDCPVGSFDIRQIIERYDECIKDAKKVLELGFEKIALTFIVTSFEIVVKELFIRNYKSWFYYYLDPNESEDEIVKKLIIETISKLNLPDYFYKSLRQYEEDLKKEGNALNGENLNKFIREELFCHENQLKYMTNVNFTRMKGTGSFAWLYKNFLHIDVAKEFQKKGNNKWNKFIDFIIKRHRVVHNYSIPVSPDYVKEGEKITGEIVEYLNNELSKTNEYISKYIKR